MANMFSFPCAILSNVDPTITWKAFFSDNIFLVTLGNYFGGWFVAITYYALYGIPANKTDFNKSRHFYTDTASLEVDNPIISAEGSIRRKDTVTA